MDTFASKWTRARRKLARFPVSDPWVLNFVSICHAVIRSLSYVFMPQEVYSDLRFLFLPPPVRGLLLLHFFANAEITFAHILVFPACATEVQHNFENCFTFQRIIKASTMGAW